MWLTNAYSAAIKRACKKAGIEPWTANRLRHSAATWMAEKYGLEAASLALGHGSIAITDAVYAERNMDKLMKMVSEAG